MRRLKRLGKVLAITVGSWVGVTLFLFVLWFCLGFFYAPDNMAYQFKSHVPDLVRTYTVLGDNAWHWYPPGVAERTTVELGYHRPTFERAMADAIIANRLYEQAMMETPYVPPEVNEDLVGIQWQILHHYRYFMADWDIQVLSVPDRLFFQKYEGLDQFRLGGYYVNLGSSDLISINLAYTAGKRFGDSPIQGTMVHELHHAQGAENAARYDERSLKWYATILNHRNEPITQLRTLEVLGHMARYDHRYYEAAYYAEIRGWAFRSAYYLMMRDREGRPWTDIPFDVPLQVAWNYYHELEEIGKAVEAGDIDRPVYDCGCPVYKSFMESWIISINGWLHDWEARNWERDFNDLYMNLYPSTPERRAYRVMRQTIREQNPWRWGAANYQYWYSPYYSLQQAIGNNGVFEWSWRIPVLSPWGHVLVEYPNNTNMLDAIYYYDDIQEASDQLMRYQGNDFLDGTQWVMWGLNLGQHHNEEQR